MCSRGLLGRLEFLYNEIDEKSARFADVSHLKCPAGCGLCCDHADTEVAPAEAELIAWYINTRACHLEDVLNIDRGDGECVFYDRDANLHCRIYPVRPLICRCFGYSAEEDRAGGLLFPACQHMDLPDGLRAGGGVARLLFEPHPPVMARYRRTINGYSGDSMRPLKEAVIQAVKTLDGTSKNPDFPDAADI